MHDRPVRVLQVIGKMQRGGAETMLMQVMRHADPARLHFDFIVHAHGSHDYDDEIRSLGGKIFVCPRPDLPIGYARKFLSVLKEQGPYDVIHSHVHHYSGYILALARLAGVPYRIAHSHSDTMAVEQASGLARQAYLKFSAGLISRFATAGLAAGSGSAQALFGVHWTDDKRWKIYPNGLNLMPFKSYIDPVLTRSNLGIPQNAFVIGHVGRFSEEKNHGFLIEIAAEVVRREPNAFLLLVGDGPCRNEIERAVQRLNLVDHVCFAGVRSDVARLMKVMDIFCLPSIFEGLPMVLLEAQAAGTLCLVSNVVCNEANVVEGLIQRLSISISASVWANRILDMRKMPAPVTREAALDVFENSRFNIENSISILEDIYGSASGSPIA